MSKRIVVVMMAAFLWAGMAQAGTRADLSGDSVVDFATTMDMPFMAVGDPGNAGEPSGGFEGNGGGRVCGAVAYEYEIGKFEVSAGQYTEFLNAVAASDPYGLYDTGMWSSGHAGKIERSGADGSYSYSVAADRTHRPVGYVNWGDAARFANWLHNGQPTGAQSLATTEDGAYYLNGATSQGALMAVTRETDWRFAIPSEDEWYKAAYYDPTLNGGTGGYYDYATGTDAAPSNGLVDPDPGNNANYWQGAYTTGAPYWKTEVGEFENSQSPYGTFDQNGNAWEWNEAISMEHRGARGGSYHASHGLPAADRHDLDPTRSYEGIGFRVVQVPEPATLVVMGCGAVGLLRRRRSRARQGKRA